MMPPIKVVVEQNDASGGHARNDAPLVVRQGHGPDPSIAAWVGEELLEVGHLPDHDHTIVSSCEQVLPVPAQLDGPNVVLCFHGGLELSVHAERTEDTVLVEYDTVALSRSLDESWFQAVFRTFQSP